MKQCLFSNCSSKEVALYESVISLIEEGEAIGSLKISQIAQRAGIGKGTTYEYFKSKEELIGKALFYNLHMKTENLFQEAGQVQGFKETMYTIFSWMEKNLKDNPFLYQLLSVNGFVYKIPEEIRKVLFDETEIMNSIQLHISGLGEMAKKEGLIGDEVPASLVNMTLTGTIMSYMMYLKTEETVKDVDRTQVKDYLFSKI